MYDPHLDGYNYSQACRRQRFSLCSAEAHLSATIPSSCLQMLYTSHRIFCQSTDPQSHLWGHGNKIMSGSPRCQILIDFGTHDVT